MKLDRVTITGADDSIGPMQLAAAGEKFPFVEWGILVSEKQCGNPRFPSLSWIDSIAEYALTNPAWFPRLSVHVCGRYVRDMLAGIPSVFANECINSLLEAAKRVQLNFHADPHQVIGVRFENLVRTRLAGKQIIFQLDGVNNEMFEGASDNLPDVAPLFDKSGGAGIVPGNWPKADYMDVTPGPNGDGIQTPIYHGYAGGLGPQTLTAELPRIADAAGDSRIWIDMERAVRSEDDAHFDMMKVLRCLEICEPFIYLPA